MGGRLPTAPEADPPIEADHLSWRQTPLGGRPPGTDIKWRPQQQSVRIQLECILVYILLSIPTDKLKMSFKTTITATNLGVLSLEISAHSIDSDGFILMSRQKYFHLNQDQNDSIHFTTKGNSFVLLLFYRKDRQPDKDTELMVCGVRKIIKTQMHTDTGFDFWNNFHPHHQIWLVLLYYLQRCPHQIMFQCMRDQVEGWPLSRVLHEISWSCVSQFRWSDVQITFGCMTVSADRSYSLLQVLQSMAPGSRNRAIQPCSTLTKFLCGEFEPQKKSSDDSWVEPYVTPVEII